MSRTTLNAIVDAVAYAGIVVLATTLQGTGTGFPAGSPEINLQENGTNLLDEGTLDFGSNTSATTRTITIQNQGDAPLDLTGSTLVSKTGDPEFSVMQQPTDPIPAGGSATFIVRFAPTANGARTATLSIANNDPDDNENPYTVTLMFIA